MGGSAQARGRFESGQMAVELAVILPVLLIAMVVVLDLLSFAGQCARFDHIAAQAVIAQGASSGNGESSLEARARKVEDSLKESFSGQEMAISVQTEEKQGLAMWETCVFTCMFNAAPWPFPPGGLTVFGVHLPTALHHEYRLAVEPYVPGELL